MADRTCATCGKPLNTHDGRQKFCSKQCEGIAHRTTHKPMASWIKPHVYLWLYEGMSPADIAKMMNRELREIKRVINDKEVIKRGMALIESSRLDGELYDASSFSCEHWPNNYTRSVCNRSIAGH